MGAELAKLPVRTDGNNQGKPVPQGNGGQPPARPQPADRNSSSPRTPARPDPDARGSGNGGTAPAGKAEEKANAGLASVTGAPPVPETPKKKQRKPRAKKKEEPASFNAQQITALLVSISSIFASRQGFEMFAISEQEAETIANPLSNIIAKNENFAALGEHADGIALVTACIVVMLPRFMLFFEVRKQNKKKGELALVRTDRTDNKKGESATDNRKPVGNRSPQPAHDADGIFAAIPSVF